MHDSNHNSKMMWLMMAGCLLLPIALLLFGGRGSGIDNSWGWYVFIGVFILIHIFMMFGHGRNQDKDDANGANDKPNNIHNH